MNYLDTLQVQFGIPMWLIIAILIWSLVWKLLALWKSAKKNQVAWFIILALVNTIGILEIFYIYVFSEMKSMKNNSPKKVSPKRKIRRR